MKQLNQHEMASITGGDSITLDIAVAHFDMVPVWSDATGHFDLWNGQSMVENP
jgi:bacteriocin-like protein